MMFINVLSAEITFKTGNNAIRKSCAPGCTRQLCHTPSRLLLVTSWPLGTVSSGIFIFGVLPFCFFDRLNITGIVKRTLTALPSAIPGDHLGIVFTTRKASSSNSGSTPLTTFPCPGVPSSITTNWIITRPETPFFWASTGYFTLVAKYFIMACMPPGNFGISSGIK